MSNTISAVVPVGATPSTQSSISAQQAPPSPPAIVQDQTETPDPANLRLMIEDDAAANTTVYKTVDRRTGEVIQQLPREAVLKLREDQNYAAGQLLKTKT